MAITSLLAAPGEINARDLLIRLMMFFVVSGVLFLVGFATERNHGKGYWVKYLAVIPALGAIWFSMDYFRFANDDLALAGGLIGGTSEQMYRASPFLSLGIALVVVIVGLLMDIRRKREAEIG